MPRITLIQQVYNSRRFVPQVYDAMVAQTFKDMQIISQIVADDGDAEEYIRQHYPQVKILKPGYNIGFSRGHNEIFAETDSEFFQLVNPDLILSPNYVEEILKAFDDAAIGSVSGKVFQYDFVRNKKLDVFDTTGIVMEKSGRGSDRGQHEKDRGQFDDKLNILGPSGAVATYRKSALESVKYPRPDGRYEYFDEDFHSYWEDSDLAWRMINAGWKSKFVPSAVAFHGRLAASSPGGYKKVFAFIRHHKNIPQRVRELNYRNHIYAFIKNSPKWYWQFFVREFFYQIYVLLLETSTLKVFPDFWRGLKNMFRKRKFIQEHRKISTEQAEKLLV